MEMEIVISMLGNAFRETSGKPRGAAFRRDRDFTRVKIHENESRESENEAA